MRAAAVHEDNICCSEWDFSAGRKKYHQGAPRAVGVWEIQDRERGVWELGCGRYPGMGGCSEGPGARGVMIHSTQRLGGGRFSGREGEVSRRGFGGAPAGSRPAGPSGILHGGGPPGRSTPRALVIIRLSPRERPWGGVMCDIDDTLIGVSWRGLRAHLIPTTPESMIGPSPSGS